MAEGGGGYVGGSTEEIAENREQQDIEIDMLQSIFESEMVVVNPGTEYLVKISPRVDNKVVLLPLAAASADVHTAPRKEVTHLPEINLYIKYPPSYPSHTPPECHLSSRWLDIQVIPPVLEHLKAMFSPSCPVVYEWIMYLKDDLIQEYCWHQQRIINISKAIESEPGASPCQMFLRSTSLIHDMEEYNNFEKFNQFQMDEHECGVCFRLLKGTAMCQPCGKCDLLYCKDCLQDYCKSCIGDKRMVVLECPDSQCHETLPDLILKKLLPQEFFERYVTFRDKVELDSLPGMVYCPRCRSRVFSDPDSKVAVCDNPECRFPFCKTCQQTWHGPVPCPALEKAAALMSEEEVDGLKKEENEENKQRRLEELQSVLWVLSSDSVRPCPNCRSHVQKNGGCNKMSCSQCGSSFCWLCGKAISGYDHFDRGGKNNCVLFRDEDYFPPTEEEDVKVDNLEDIEAAMNSKCPRCEKIELKSSDDNWIHCRRCGFQYCHTCGEACFGVYHFNSKYGCKRYSSLKEDVTNNAPPDESKDGKDADAVSEDDNNSDEGDSDVGDDDNNDDDDLLI